MSDLLVFLNGRLVPASEARIGAFDAGLLHGASVFTTMLAHRGKVFRLEGHLRRLADSCRALGLRAGMDSQALASAVGEVLRANELAEARMRITLTPGSVKEDASGGTTLITVEPAQEPPRQWYEEGISVVVSSFRQNKGDPSCGHKTGNYLSRILARREAARKGAEEALWYTGENLLAGACFCNVFLVMESVTAKEGGEAEGNMSASAGGGGPWQDGASETGPRQDGPEQAGGPDGSEEQPCEPKAETDQVGVAQAGPPPAGPVTVHTPPLETPALPGIVRRAVIELCGRLGIACDDRSPLTVRQMLAAREMFLTSSTTGIRPVARVERHGVGDEKPGAVTRRLMEAYKELVERECA